MPHLSIWKLSKSGLSKTKDNSLDKIEELSWGLYRTLHNRLNYLDIDSNNNRDDKEHTCVHKWTTLKK